MKIRILHCHSTFALGGKEARAVRLMNAWGDRAEHVVLSAVPDALSARDAVWRGVDVTYPADAPSLTGRPGPSRYRQLARYMSAFDLVLSYNWGAMDAVMARRLHGGPPLVHHEDGFNADEWARQKRRRIAFRRLALPAARHLVVPSRTLETIARTSWAQPPERVRRIGNGIDLSRIDPARPAPWPHLRHDHGEVNLVTVAGLRAVKNLTEMVRQVAQLSAICPARLTIIGEGPEREAIAQEARNLAIADRVHLPGFVTAPGAVLPHFDLFLLTSLSEQFPIGLVEAMTAGLPVVATDVGDVAEMVSPANRPHVAASLASFQQSLQALAASPEEARRIGTANRVRALAEFDETRMIESYAELYGDVIGRPDALRSSSSAAF